MNDQGEFLISWDLDLVCKNMFLSSFQGMKIVAVTCSTEKAEEYVFQGGKIDPKTNTTVYNCMCKGASSLFVSGSNKMQCIIHYWMCPFSS